MILGSHYDTIAKQRAGNIEGWEPFYLELITGGLIIKGGVPTLVTRGPTKGEKRWNTKEAQTVMVSNDDADREYVRYEAETGNCGGCFGDGKSVFNELKPCKKCNGTGKAKAA